VPCASYSNVRGCGLSSRKVPSLARHLPEMDPQRQGCCPRSGGSGEPEGICAAGALSLRSIRSSLAQMSSMVQLMEASPTSVRDTDRER
jgi:hypothetical protein